MFKIKNTILKKGDGSTLNEALAVFKKLFEPKRVTTLYDGIGKIGYKIGNIFLLAKRHSGGNIVSVHKMIWERAKKENAKIVIYIRESGYFYHFDPETIQKTIPNTREDTRENCEMINFDFSNGTNLMQLVAYKRKIERVAEKNRQYLEKNERPQTKEEKDKEMLMIATS